MSERITPRADRHLHHRRIDSASIPARRNLSKSRGGTREFPFCTARRRFAARTRGVSFADSFIGTSGQGQK